MLLVAANAAYARTLISSQADEQKLLGTHLFSLQWISWDQFGKAVVTDKNGTLHIYGEQRIQADIPDTETDDDSYGFYLTYDDKEGSVSPSQDEYV